MFICLSTGAQVCPFHKLEHVKQLAQKLKQGLSFPYFLMAMETSRKSIHFLGGRGGMYHGMRTLPMHVQVRGYFQFGHWQERLASISKHTDVFKKTPIIWKCFWHPSIVSSPLLLSFLQELKSYLLIIKKFRMISAMIFFSFRNLSPAKYRFHNKDSGKNIQGNTLRQKPPGQTPGGFGQSGNLYLGVSDRCEPEVLVSFTWFGWPQAWSYGGSWKQVVLHFLDKPHI